ncbi:MAG: DUF945 family protein [Gammaproteobacteria bacterium]
MKKWLWTSLIILGVVVILAILSPLLLSFVVEHQYHKQVANWNQSPTIRVNLTQYHRGWLHSHAELQLNLSHPAFIPSNMVLQQAITQGPLIHLTTTQGQSNWLFGRALINSTLRSDLGIIRAITLVKFNGEILTVLHAPELHHFNPSSALSLQINGLNAFVLLSSDLKKLSGKFYIPQLALNTAQYKQVASGIEHTFNLQKTASQLYLGDRLIKVATVSWLSPNNRARIDFTGLNMTTNSQEQPAQKLTYELQVNLHSVNTNGGSYGPQQLHFTLKDLDIPALLAFGNFLPSHWAENTQNLQRLLDKGLNFDLRTLNLNTAMGKASMTAKASWAPQITRSSKGLLTHLQSAEVHLSIAEALLSDVMGKFKILEGGWISSATLQKFVDNHFTKQTDHYQLDWILNDPSSAK